MNELSHICSLITQTSVLPFSLSAVEQTHHVHTLWLQLIYYSLTTLSPLLLMWLYIGSMCQSARRLYMSPQVLFVTSLPFILLSSGLPLWLSLPFQPICHQSRHTNMHIFFLLFNINIDPSSLCLLRNHINQSLVKYCEVMSCGFPLWPIGNLWWKHYSDYDSSCICTDLLTFYLWITHSPFVCACACLCLSQWCLPSTHWVAEPQF